MDLTSALASRRWIQRTYPFPHLLARDALAPSLLDEQEAALRELLSQGRFSRSVSGYDALIAGFSHATPEPLRFFTSRPFHDLMARLLGVRATGDVDGGLHHHPIGSRSGWVHSDLVTGWFAGEAGPASVNLSDASRCVYTSGRAAKGITPREVVRAGALLFFLGNPPYTPGDGGETGLFASRADEAPSVRVPPSRNTLLAFRCSPWSFHAFLSNRRHARSSVVLWIHERIEDAASRYGAGAVQRWRRG